VTCKKHQNEKRVVIKYLNFKGLTPNEIAADMKVVLGDMPLRMLQFTNGLLNSSAVENQLTEDARRSGRPVEACTEENVQRVNDMLMTDGRLTVRYVAECLKLTYGTTNHIFDSASA